MKIKVTEERECCAQSDLRRVEGCIMRGREPDLMFCIHCGHRHEWDTRRDPAGGVDTFYRKLPEPPRT